MGRLSMISLRGVKRSASACSRARVKARYAPVALVEVKNRRLVLERLIAVDALVEAALDEGNLPLGVLWKSWGQLTMSRVGAFIEAHIERGIGSDIVRPRQDDSLSVEVGVVKIAREGRRDQSWRKAGLDLVDGDVLDEEEVAEEAKRDLAAEGVDARGESDVLWRHAGGVGAELMKPELRSKFGISFASLLEMTKLTCWHMRIAAPR